jgi:hypothetical protein
MKTIPHGNSLEYIASGNGFTRITYAEAYETPECKDYINGIFDTVRAKNSHGLGLLFNAFSESAFGKIFENYRGSLDSIHADSGGLQIITCGSVITPEVKKEIYGIQGKYSDVAMCFDEIPLSFTGKKSSRLDMTNRYFDKAKLEPCARETGRNVNEQINIFKDGKSNARPCIIMQGNDYDSYMKWAEYVWDEISVENRALVGGVAMSGASLGIGASEDIRRSFYYTQLPIEVSHKHLHMLGVGSVNRLLPNLMFIKNGVYKDTHFSYDSTTHTSGIHMGRTYIDGDNFEYPRAKVEDKVTGLRLYNKVIYGKIYNDIKELFGIKMNLDQYVECMNSASIPYKEKYGTRVPVIEAYAATAFQAIHHFMVHVEKVLHDEKLFFDIARSQKNENVYHSLNKVRTADDFRHWENHIGRHAKSKKILNTEPSSIDDFY